MSLQDGESDFYCWLCHKEGHVICCELCPRVFHAKCLGADREPTGEWVCPECEVTMVNLLTLFQVDLFFKKEKMALCSQDNVYM